MVSTSISNLYPSLGFRFDRGSGQASYPLLAEPEPNSEVCARSPNFISKILFSRAPKICFCILVDPPKNCFAESE